MRKGTILDSDYLGSNPGSASCLTQNKIFNLLGPQVAHLQNGLTAAPFPCSLPQVSEWVLPSCVGIGLSGE